MSLTLFYNMYSRGAAIGDVTHETVSTTKIFANGDFGVWTHIVEIESNNLLTAALDNKKKIFFYNMHTYGGALGFLESTTFTTTTVFPEGSLGAWTHIAAIGQLIFFYDKNSGAGAIATTDDTKGIVIIKSYNQGSFGTWTHIVDSGPYLFFYNKNNRAGSIGKLSKEGLNTVKDFGNGSFSTWTNIVGAMPYLLFYNKDNGAGSVGKLSDEGLTAIKDFPSETFGQWTHLTTGISLIKQTKNKEAVPVNPFPGMPVPNLPGLIEPNGAVILAYNSASGAGALGHLSNDGFKIIHTFDSGSFGYWTSISDTSAHIGDVSDLLSSLRHKLIPGETLAIGQELYSQNLKFVLKMQSDGNLVLYRVQDAQALWATGTEGKGATRAAMQKDGNLVLYKASIPVWASNTEKNAGALLKLQNDGNLVIYKGATPIWDTGVYAPKGRFCGVLDPSNMTINLQSFGSPAGRWSRGSLKVSINPTGGLANSPLSPNDAVNIITNAFKKWEKASNFFAFNIVPVGSGEDIRVIFGGNQVDKDFGKPGGRLASAGYPERGNLQFDAVESWTKDTLLSVALHEIGHLLGLSHSNTPGGTMYPYEPSSPLKVIDNESKDAIHALYGWKPQQIISDRSTSHRATLGYTRVSNFTGSFTIGPHMVWKGNNSDSGIYHSVFVDNQWSPQQQVTGAGCSFSPSLTEFNNGLLMAWKGVNSDSGIYWTRYSSSGGWEGQRQVANIGCSATPALANVKGRVFMAWKGVNGDTAIYWSRYDGSEGWSSQRKITGVGTSDSPTLVAFGNKLYMFWKGVPGDSNAYYSSFDMANDPIWKPQRRIEFSRYDTDGGVSVPIGTSGELSATVRGSRIMLAWKGAGNDSAIWFSFFENDEFSGQVKIADVGTSVGPSLAHVGNQTFMAWKGINGDSSIYWALLS